MYFLSTQATKNMATIMKECIFKEAVDSIAGNTVAPYRSLKKFFNYHIKLLFIAIYKKINFQIENYIYDVHVDLSIKLFHALILPSFCRPLKLAI